MDATMWDGAERRGRTADRGGGRGEAGRSAESRYERLRRRDAERLAARWGSLARFATALGPPQRSTTAWALGAAGERHVGAALERAIGDRGAVLHDRRIPHSLANIDHVVVGPSGVWVVDAKHYRGTIERRDRGGWFGRDLRLYVAGRDRTSLVDGLGWQGAAVEQVLLGGPRVPVHLALCFTGAEWPLFLRPFKVHGVWVTAPGALGRMIVGRGQGAGRGPPLGGARIEEIAALLGARLPMR